MNGLDKLEEIKNGLIGHCKSSYLKDQPNNELGKVIMVYEGMFNAIEKELKVLQILREKKVDLSLIDNLIYKAKEIWNFNLDLDLESAIKEITIKYNVRNNIHLTEKEIQLIVEWLREE